LINFNSLIQERFRNNHNVPRIETPLIESNSAMELSFIISYRNGESQKLPRKKKITALVLCPARLTNDCT